jgi:hypothetical protein
MKINFLAIVLCCIAFGLPATSIAAGLNTNFVFKLNSTASFVGDASLHVQEHNKDGELTIGVDFYLGDLPTPDDLYRKLQDIPRNQVSVWVLTKEGECLKLVKVLPEASSKLLLGEGKSYSGTASIFYTFSRTNAVHPMAVILKFKKEYREFALSE